MAQATEVIHYSRKAFDDEEDELARLEAQLEDEVQLETGYSNFIFVDNTPVVASDKFEKLSGVLFKVFSACGKIVQPDGLYIPLNPTTGKTEGYVMRMVPIYSSLSIDVCIAS